MISPGTNFTPDLDPVILSKAYKAAASKKRGDSSKNRRESVEDICNFWRCQQGGASAMAIDEKGNTMLHFLAMNDHTVALRKLLDNRLLLISSKEELKPRNRRGDTPLHEAAMFGRKKFAEIMMEKDTDLVLERNELGETPLYCAAACGEKDIFDFLKLKVDKNNVMAAMTRNDGWTVLHAAVMEEHYDLAKSILDSFPDLGCKHDEKGTTALNLLAEKPSSFKSGSSYSSTNIGSWPFIPLQIIGVLIYKYHAVHLRHNGFQARLSYLLFYPFILCGFNGIDEAKRKHTYASELATMLIKEENWRDYENSNCEIEYSALTSCLSQTRTQTQTQRKIFNKMKNLLIQATKHGISELVRQILEQFPQAAYAYDENGKNILHIAVEKKDRVLYRYFLEKTIAIKDMVDDVDNEGNTVLHLAANLGTSPRVLLGHLNQMTWDVCWFKHVWYGNGSPSFLHLQNHEGKTPKEVFKESHLKLQKQSEAALKEMNQGLMLVSTLIGTVNYAALFTIPGGFEKDSGLPVFYYKDRHELNLFMWYIGQTLVSSLVALLIMLSIQLSRFRISDFFMALPFRFLTAIATLFFSTISTILACSQTYALEQIPFFRNWMLMSFSCVALGLLFIDTIYLTVIYMSFAIRYSFDYEGQEILDLLI